MEKFIEAKMGLYVKSWNMEDELIWGKKNAHEKPFIIIEVRDVKKRKEKKREKKPCYIPQEIPSSNHIQLQKELNACVIQ